MISAFLTTVLFTPFASLGSTSIQDWLVLAAFGATNYAIAFALFMAGARYTPPADAAIISILDTVLAPTWVWLIFGEAATGATLLGGAAIIAAVLWQTLPEARSQREGVTNG